ncbi:MAG: hypothetical protein GY749_07705 [Desulfobacteraceae bacterium]|nr:hypothetical protein [Desulfobacteraceae bacterium]
MPVFSKSHRYYLNGIDWAMVAIDRLNKKHTDLGNHSSLILVLKGHLDKTSLAERLAKVLSNSSFVKGKIRRAWHLAPYWVSEPSDFTPQDMRFFKLESENQDDLDSVIQNCATTPFKDEKTLLGFDLIHYSRQSYLIMRFDHKMFDARGAEALLERILDEKDTATDGQYNLPSQDAQLRSWKSRFLSGQIINRFLISGYSKGTRVAYFDQKFNLDSSHIFFYNTFSSAQTSVIDNNAVKKAGYLMNGIYLLACVTKSFDLSFKNRNHSDNMLIPINVDVRETKFSHAKIFFNNLSFMLFNVKQGFSLTEITENLKKQFIDQIRNKIPYHFINASLLMRIMPLALLSCFMSLKMKKYQCSFSFSYISEQAFHLNQVQGHEVVNLFHMPLVPVNPGIGVFFTRFNKKLNMIISSFDNRLSVQEGKYLQEKILSEIINEKI